MSSENKLSEVSQTHKLIVGHVLDGIRSLPSESIDLCVTSPPYWGLRDLGRNSICIEINRDYEVLWRNRLDTANTLDIKYVVEIFGK